MPAYRLIACPTVIPAPGGKHIEEIFGRVSTGDSTCSVARMVAPPGWSEPAQVPEFGELTVMVRGRLQVDVGGEMVDLGPGQALWAEPGLRVRYHNPFGEACEYYAICVPAFSPEAAHRVPS